MILEIGLGAFAALLLILGARRGSLGRQYLLLAVGLVVTALIYVAIAVGGSAPSYWLVIEIAGVVPFALLAWLGVRGSPVWLALGWAVHVAWDTGLHLGTRAPSFVPSLLPTFCIGFDLVIAGYLVVQIYAARATRPEAA